MCFFFTAYSQNVVYYTYPHSSVDKKGMHEARIKC